MSEYFENVVYRGYRVMDMGNAGRTLGIRRETKDQQAPENPLMSTSWGPDSAGKKPQGKKYLLPALQAKSFLRKSLPACQANLPQPPNRRFEFHKRHQLFIRAHNETLSIAAMRVSNEDCSPVGINR